MPNPKVPCPSCGQPKSAKAVLCRQCSPSYERTPERRQHMSEVLSGKPKPWLQGRQRPEHSQTMKEYWTPERREEKRQAMLLLNPEARYHGLSCKGAKRLRAALEQCEACGGDGSDSRLDVHHRNGNKRDQSLANLTVLCHRCHMQLHSEQGDLKRSSVPG